ncbi:ABC transporter ATP-binding protein [Nonomuraea rubra]
MLKVDGLTVRADTVELVRDVSFAIAPGERVGLIGESGSGKSLTALSLMGLLPEGVTASGLARLGDHDLVGVPESRLKSLRGRELSMVFQEPMTALNPLMRIGAQVAEVMTLHGRPRQEAHRRSIELLERVRLPEPAQLARAYPHQLSGGQRQRVMLAIALANNPGLLICDEPTTALDVTVQKQMLDLIAEVAPALLFITHDLAVVAAMCERVLVMYGGRVVESGTLREVFTRPPPPLHAGPAGRLQAHPARHPPAHHRRQRAPGGPLPQRLRLPQPLPARHPHLRDDSRPDRRRPCLRMLAPR